ncbi:hypothetical protein GCK72_020402 [Caenorhabditis remanei]|uniref:Uncharacterized protein n=1 Tax=Caenorhabditis remanei TaxID=31234 RepID=A0A6A5GGZ8_CAERE|nr:hypothetical protein GCK72_020402 [Caenorhabditis remanei]KAF1753845.1 hypothetical protein GCK72_020402 [Caenorhabditis remanei]
MTLSFVPLDWSPISEKTKRCEICNRVAFGKHYGALSCYACKMFYRRVVVKKLSYKCRGFNECSRSPKRLLKCQACRYQKCQDKGMYMEPLEDDEVKSEEASDDGILELTSPNQKIEKLSILLKNLNIMDKKRHAKLKSFYSLNDESLETILMHPGVVRNTKKDPDHQVTPEEWAFLALYSHITYFHNFEFIRELGMDDKKKIFQYNTLKLTYFCGLMRTLNEKRMRMLNPGGQEIYPDDLIDLYRTNPHNLARICCQPVNRLIELKVTNEEYCLMNIIFFCNPAIPDISDEARLILSRHQGIYSNALFQYCELTNQQNAPTRMTDLIWLYEYITKNSQEMETLFMIFHCNAPHFKFRKLIRDTFHF